MTKKEKYIQIIKTWAKGVLYGRGLKRYFMFTYYPHVSPQANLGINYEIGNPENFYMEGNSTLKADSVIMNGRAKFIMKKNSGAAEQFMVIAGNHMSIVGMNVKQVTNDVKDIKDIYHEYDKDVVVDEDVWIGARVTILSGVHIGRGCELGTGSVIRKSTPPYSIVVGNPAKVIGFRFTPEEIVEHEKVQYPVEERIPIEVLNKNYRKYFLDRIKDIKSFIK